jgi:hypothetical protein
MGDNKLEMPGPGGLGFTGGAGQLTLDEAGRGLQPCPLVLTGVQS